jgi:hypothetical protein
MSVMVGSLGETVCPGSGKGCVGRATPVELVRKGFQSRTFLFLTMLELLPQTIPSTIPGHQSYLRNLNIAHMNLDKNVGWAWFDPHQQGSVLRC